MSELPSPQAEAAYRRALSAYQKGSYDEAQRWATEALAFEPAHAAAAALLRRLGGREAGPRVVSTDPSILVGGNGGYGTAEPADPTIIVPRRAPQPAAPKRRPAPPSPPHGSSARRASEPTVIVPSNGGSHSWGEPSYDRPASSLWQRLRGGAGRRDGFGAAPSRARGFLIVAGAVAFAAAAVWGVVWFVSRPSGPRLTVEVAEGGRIVGDGIRCGAGSSSCSKPFSNGDRVELTPEPERDYEFVGFTGDCAASRGVLLMDGPKTCGATFEKRPPPPSGAATYTLTIDKPKNGTILYELTAITCGSLGSECSEEIPAGKLVTLRFQADDGYKFDSFSGECTGGEFVMNSATTCGAVFIASPMAVNTLPAPKGDSGPGNEVRRGRNKPEPKPDGTVQTPPSIPPAAPPVNPPAPTPDPPVAVVPPTQGTPPGLVKPPPMPLTEEEHAKKEIKQRLDEYCSALETLKPEEVLKVFPRQDARILKRQFQGTKSLKCAWTSEPKYNRFDIGVEKGTGGAQVEVGMKQTVQLQGGGAPKAPQETIVTIDLSRFDRNSSWKIVDMHAVEKK